MSEESSIKIHFIKTPDFKTSLATGIFGGPTAQGLININFFIDRAPLPKSITYAVEGNVSGEEIDRDSKDGFIREVHSGVLVDINTAKSIVEWLNNKIEILEENTKVEK